jgi:hypothetical protein
MNFPFAYPHYETLKKFDGSFTVRVQTSTNDLLKRIINLRPGYDPSVCEGVSIEKLLQRSITAECG